MPAAPTPRRTCGESAEACTFSPSKVYLYLVCYRQAVRFGESFAEVLKARTRNSRAIDPWVRSGKADRQRAVDIGLSLELASARTGIALAPHNAERLAAALCDHGKPG